MQLPSEFLHNRLDTIDKLDKLLQQIDPASVATVCIRRGVACDNPDVEGDAENRPWIEVEFSYIEDATDAIALLKKASIKSAKFWAKRTDECRRASEAALTRFKEHPRIAGSA